MGADCFEKDCDLDPTESDSPIALGDRDAGPPLVEHRLPQLGVIRGTGLRVRPNLCRRAAAVEQLARGIPQRLLVVVQLEVHVRPDVPDTGVSIRSDLSWTWRRPLSKKSSARNAGRG